MVFQKINLCDFFLLQSGNIGVFLSLYHFYTLLLKTVFLPQLSHQSRSKLQFFAFTGLSFLREIWLDYPKFRTSQRPICLKDQLKCSYVKKRKNRSIGWSKKLYRLNLHNLRINFYFAQFAVRLQSKVFKIKRKREK